MNHRLQQLAFAVFTIPLLAAAAYCSYKIYQLSKERAVIKTDYSAVNNITYGLLSVDAWKDHLIRIISNRIDDFELTRDQEKLLKSQIETVLHAVINKADTIMHQKRKTLKGKVRKVIINALVNEKKIHEQVPTFAQTIVNEIKKVENKAKLKALVLSKIEDYGAITYDSANDVARMEKILQKYSVEDLKTFNEQLEFRAADLRSELYKLAIIEILLAIMFPILWWILFKRTYVHNLLFTLSILMALIVLAGGLTAPMIEIDARITEMTFSLLGEKIAFYDQIIFFQSKSIVDVVHILVSTGQWDSIIVGLLIMIFSIVFPIAKLVSSKFYVADGNSWRNSKVIRFFALKSGKWSMADVYVVAIFMAYIGFKSILDNQLTQLNIQTNSLASISTNETTLQPGFLLFICFVLYGLLLSSILEKSKSVTAN